VVEDPRRGRNEARERHNAHSESAAATVINIVRDQEQYLVEEQYLV